MIAMFNQKIFTPLIFIFFIVTPLAGDDLQSLTITTSNDVFNGNLTLCRDDYRSYGVGIELTSMEGYFGIFDYYGLTERAVNLRSDLMEVVMGKAIPFNMKKGSLIISPFAGGLGYGNLGGQFFQNIIHRIFGINLVTFDYSGSGESKNGLEPMIGVRVYRRLEGFPLGNFFLIPEMTGSLKWSIPSSLAYRGGVNLGLEGKGEDFFQMNLGWEGVNSSFPNQVVELVLDQEKGPTLGTSLRTGILSYNNKVYLDSIFNGFYFTALFK